MVEYLVRHVQSSSNDNLHYQGPEDPSTDSGIIIGHKLGLRFAKLPVDIIISSDYTRAVQTAHIIDEHLEVKKEIVFTSLLREFKHPTEVEGRPINDPEAYRIMEQTREHFTDPNWRYSDEENFFDLVARAKAYEEFLKTFKQEHVLTVTHGGFLKMLVAVRVWGSHISPEIWHNFDQRFMVDNTGITLLEKNQEGLWMVKSFNDIAHLA
jgi:broad specificity phosphatase PhoE